MILTPRQPPLQGMELLLVLPLHRVRAAHRVPPVQRPHHLRAWPASPLHQRPREQKHPAVHHQELKFLLSADPLYLA